MSDDGAVDEAISSGQRIHQPVVVPGAGPAPGTWGVICDACSAAAQDYVYPCKMDTRRGSVVLESPWPPQWLYERPPDE